MLKRPLDDKFPTNQKSEEGGGGGGCLDLPPLQEAEHLPVLGVEGTPHLPLLVCAAAFLSLSLPSVQAMSFYTFTLLILFPIPMEEAAGWGLAAHLPIPQGVLKSEQN